MNQTFTAGIRTQRNLLSIALAYRRQVLSCSPSSLLLCFLFVLSCVLSCVPSVLPSACFRACQCLPSVLVLSCFFRSIRASDRFVLPIDSCFRALCCLCFVLFCFSAFVRACFLCSVLLIFRSIRAFDRFMLSCFVLPVLRAVLLFCVRACFRACSLSVLVFSNSKSAVGLCRH